MKRPHKALCPEMLRSLRIQKEDKLIRLKSFADGLVDALEERETRYKAMHLKDLHPYLGTRDYATFVYSSVKEQRQKLEEELREIDDEFEEREEEQADAKDKSSGLAA